MSTTEYPNRNALRDANDIYLDAMRPFILHYLKRVPGETVKYLIQDALKDEQADDFWKKLDEDDDIESAIDFSYFPLIIRGNWIIPNKRNYGFAQQFKDDMNVQSALWLIRQGRNECEHRGTKDLDSEFVRINLFLIADVLGKINRPDKQREVGDIRDKLFADDTPERLAEAEAKNAKYEKSVAEAEKRSEAAELEKREYEKDNAALSNQVNEKDGRLKKLSKQLKTAKTGRDNYKKDLAGAKKRLVESEEAKTDYKERFETASKELKDTKEELGTFAERLVETSNQLAQVQAKKKSAVERFAAMKDLFMTATLDKPEIRSVFPALDTDARIRILDRRGTDKSNYLLELLEQKQPTVIYVQNEEKIDLLLTRVLPEKADVIGRHDAHTSEAQEMEILEKLENGELIAIVSSGTISTLQGTHHIEHFVFCHLAPDLDVFFKRCQPAFTATKNSYLHLIYNSKQDIKGLDEWLAQKYPDRETLGKLYTEMKKIAETKDSLINPEKVYDKLDMAKPGIETGFTIFEELCLLERSKDDIKLLPGSGRKLNESKIYCSGEKLKQGIADVHTFQLEQPIEKIWEEILKKVNIDDKQILHEHSTHKINSEVSEVEDDAQPTTGTDRNKVTPPTPTIWPQRGISTFNALRQRAANNFTVANTILSAADEPISAELNERPSLVLKSVKRSPLSEDIEDYRNKYDLAMQFVQEHGIGALEQGIAQLIKHRDDPDYDFTEDETNMLRAFQHALTDFQTQYEKSAAAKPSLKPPRANAKVTEEQVKEIRSRSAAGESNSKLAKEFGLTPPAVRSIVMRNTWKHVE